MNCHQWMNILLLQIQLSTTSNNKVSRTQDYFSSTSEMAKLFKWEDSFLKYLMNCKTSLTDKGDKSPEYTRFITNFTADFPKDIEQWEGTLDGLFLLQNSFNLNISEFSEGVVKADALSNSVFSSHTRLKYEDLDQIAKAAYNRGFYHRAVEWFREAVNSAVMTKLSAMVTAARNLLQTTMKVHDKVLDTKGHQGQIKVVD